MCTCDGTVLKHSATCLPRTLRSSLSALSAEKQDHIPVDRGIRSVSLQNVHVDNHIACWMGFYNKVGHLPFSAVLLQFPLLLWGFSLHSLSLSSCLLMTFSLLPIRKAIIHSLLPTSLMGNFLAVSSCQWNIFPELTLTSSTALSFPHSHLARHPSF